MRKLLLCAAMLGVASGTAFAQDATIVAPGGPDAVVVQHREIASPDTRTKTVTETSDGCVSKTVKKTNDEGDRVSKTKTNC